MLIKTFIILSAAALLVGCRHLDSDPYGNYGNTGNTDNTISTTGRGAPSESIGGDSFGTGRTSNYNGNPNSTKPESEQ